MKRLARHSTSLISGDRLKEYRVEDRIDLDKRLPGAKPREALLSPSPVDKSNDWEAALRILKERTVNKKREWLVLFSDKSQWWCSDVTPALIREFRIRQARRNRRLKKIGVAQVSAALTVLNELFLFYRGLRP